MKFPWPKSFPKLESRIFLLETVTLWVTVSSNANKKPKTKKETDQKETRYMSNNKKLAGKVAVVTGASKGIGASIAKNLAAEGAAVVVNYASSKAGADRVVAEILKTGGQAVAVQADVSKPEDIKRLFVKT